MTKDEVLSRLKAAESELRARGVAHAALFGSIARGKSRPGSDIDIMVEIEPHASVGYFKYVAIVNSIRDLFSEPVDVSDRGMLKPHVRPTAERDAIYAF